jgi:hypothetical protein
MPHLQEWQAILLAYGVLLVLAQTGAAPLAPLMAWGVAVTYVLNAASGGDFIGGLFSAPNTQGPQNQGNNG